MDECFRLLNQQSQYIRFTREQPTNGWLPYLNVQFKLSGCNAIVRWYRKKSCKNILLHARSSHPSAIKHAVIRNMFRTAAQVCTGDEERTESRAMALSIAKNNGYQMHHLHGRIRKSDDAQHGRRIPLCLPYISEQVSAAIQHSIKRAQLCNDIIFVNIPSNSIKKRLVRNRLYDKYCISKECTIYPYNNVGDCAKTGILVYQIDCLTCGATYIGETGRPLVVRMKEHLANKRKGSLTSPLGRHKHNEHGDNDYLIKCSILAYEPDISARKALEAFWIPHKNPQMNNRNECLAITNEFLPFIPLCEL